MVYGDKLFPDEAGEYFRLFNYWRIKTGLFVILPFHLLLIEKIDLFDDCLWFVQ